MLFGFENTTVVKEGGSDRGLCVAVPMGCLSEKDTEENQPVKTQPPSLSTYRGNYIRRAFPDSEVWRI